MNKRMRERSKIVQSREKAITQIPCDERRKILENHLLLEDFIEEVILNRFKKIEGLKETIGKPGVIERFVKDEIVSLWEETETIGELFYEGFIFEEAEIFDEYYWRNSLDKLKEEVA